MKPLLDISSPLCLKRLVRELNAQPDGFYAPVAGFVLRCNRARLRAGTIEVRSPSSSPEWFIPANREFQDPYGRSICASRRAA